MVVVRRLEPGDWRAYRELRLEALKDTPLAFVEQYADALARPDSAWRERAEHRDGTYTVVAVAPDGSFVGKATGMVYAAGCADIVAVYVAPGHRGTGVARELLEALLDWAGAGGLRTLQLCVVESNDRALAFYERFGFVATGETMPYEPDPRHVERVLEYRLPG